MSNIMVTTFILGGTFITMNNISTSIQIIHSRRSVFS